MRDIKHFRNLLHSYFFYGWSEAAERNRLWEGRNRRIDSCKRANLCREREIRHFSVLRSHPKWEPLNWRQDRQSTGTIQHFCPFSREDRLPVLRPWVLDWDREFMKSQIIWWKAPEARGTERKRGAEGRILWRNNDSDVSTPGLLQTEWSEAL